MSGSAIFAVVSRFLLFGIKGAGNLKSYTIISFGHCAKEYLPYY